MALKTVEEVLVPRTHPKALLLDEELLERPSARVVRSAV
jgi:hypothetical protein